MPTTSCMRVWLHSAIELNVLVSFRFYTKFYLFDQYPTLFFPSIMITSKQTNNNSNGSGDNDKNERKILQTKHLKWKINSSLWKFISFFHWNTKPTFSISRSHKFTSYFVVAFLLVHTPYRTHSLRVRFIWFHHIYGCECVCVSTFSSALCHMFFFKHCCVYIRKSNDFLSFSIWDIHYCPFT